MKLEHFALNVSDPLAMADWYVEHLGLQIVRQKKEAPYTTFIGDNSGQILVEIYNNPPDGVPAYSQMNHLVLHLAFVSEDPQKDKERLIGAGASSVEDLAMEDGTQLFMLRDPWGLAIQLCKRTDPMLR
jgi:glyoxylase I family protein